MTQKKQLLKEDIFKAVDEFDTLTATDSLEVRDVFVNLTKRFRSLKMDDFMTKSHYEIYLKSLNLSNDLYLMEYQSLSNGDDYATSANFFQIKMSLMGYIGWLDKNY